MTTLISLKTLPMPRSLWIELTSRCPFDCVFCTRASLRGAGNHMDFALFRRLIAELDAPQIIRLNYAGESGHYPQLAEATALAASTGAQVELVSALASLRPKRLQALLDAGLSRLTVSLHTLDSAQFSDIYRFGSLATMLERLDQVLAWRAGTTRPFGLDLAFVAMQQNLSMLPKIAAFAAERGITVLAVHPLIARDPLPMGQGQEHNGDGALSPDFAHALAHAVQQARAASPEVLIQLSSHELAPAAALQQHPQPWPWPLPRDGRLAGCDQSPFDSVHVLADGHVVVCEVLEKISLGNLAKSSLRSIWQGERYQAFRARHWHGRESACQSCVYKTAYRQGPPRIRLSATNLPAAQLLHGWYSDDGHGLRWSASEAALWLPASQWRRRLHLRGVLAEGMPTTSLSLRVNDVLMHFHQQAGGIELRLALPKPVQIEGRDGYVLRLHAEHAASPLMLGQSEDGRTLGFGLISAELIL